VSRLRGGYRHSRGGDPDEPGRGAGLPDARTSLRGLTAEGDEAWLARAISQKLYRCPGCHREVPIGTDHVVVHFVRRAGGSDHHHWHRDCVAELLLPTLRSVRRVSAAESSGDRLRERGRRPAGRRRRR
jgi:hypothetical protein